MLKIMINHHKSSLPNCSGSSRQSILCEQPHCYKHPGPQTERQMLQIYNDITDLSAAKSPHTATQRCQPDRLATLDFLLDQIKMKKGAF